MHVNLTVHSRTWSTHYAENGDADHEPEPPSTIFRNIVNVQQRPVWIHRIVWTQTQRAGGNYGAAIPSCRGSPGSPLPRHLARNFVRRCGAIQVSGGSEGSSNGSFCRTRFTISRCRPRLYLILSWVSLPQTQTETEGALIAIESVAYISLYTGD